VATHSNGISALQLAAYNRYASIWKRFAGATPMPMFKPQLAEMESTPSEAADYIHTQLKDLAQFAQRSDLDSVARLIVKAALEAQLQWAFRQPSVH
jgi:hypothetical protein